MALQCEDQTTSARFGNTLRTVVPGVISMALFGLLTACILAVVKATHQSFAGTWYALFLFPVGLPLIFLAACSPTLLFCISIQDGRVKHLLLNRYVLSDFPVADFRRMEGHQAGFASVIRFKGDKSIRFFGAHLRIMAELHRALVAAKRVARSNPKHSESQHEDVSL